MLFDQRPERDDEGIDLFVGPGGGRSTAIRYAAGRGGCGHGFAEGGPFGGIFVTLERGSEIDQPAGARTVAEVGQVPLRIAEGGKFADFRVGIEGGRGGVPALVGAEMNRGIEPVAPARDGTASQGVTLFGEFGSFDGFWPEVIAGAAVFDAERYQRATKGVGVGIVGGAEPEHGAEKIATAFAFGEVEQVGETAPGWPD